MDWSDFDAALFDLDGVITPTAEVHMRAWSTMFGDFLREEGIDEPYTDADYFTYVDGKPRYDGVRSFLESRHIELPEGHPDDSPDEKTICGLGNRKNQAFEEVLKRDGVEAYPGSRRLVEALAGRGVAMAVVSSSRNAPDVLRAAGMIDFFPTIVDGRVAGDRHLAGKPAPDTFLFAAEQVGTEPARAVVLEDALSGVAAGRAGHFGLVVGVDRGVGAEALIENGADTVVNDLEELL
jgi:beta-phosphoglucomutase family hydrolase